jgi:hypothetical protein
VQQLIGAETNFIPRQPQNAWVARPEHLDFRSPPQAKLFKLVDMVGMAENVRNQSAMSGGKAPQRNGLGRMRLFHVLWSRLTVSEYQY